MLGIDFLSTWFLIRISGFLAFFWFTFSIAAGLMGQISLCKPNKPLINELHKKSGWLGFLTTLFHMFLLLVDPYITYHIFELFIPFQTEYEPIYSALGTLSFYLAISTIFTSDFLIKKLGRKIWKKVHLLVLPAWLLMLLHGIFIGTDTVQPLIASFYGGSTILILFLGFFRYLEGHLKTKAPMKKRQI